MSMPTDNEQNAADQDDLIHNDLHDRHRSASGLSDVILGGQDGLVNVLGVILGVAAATGDTRIVLVAGMAAAFAESVSMGAVAYTSTVADRDLYESERQREYRHVLSVPELERSEIRRLYKDKGFRGRMLDQIVETITANPDVWVALMMAEEHQLRPVERSHAVRSALIVGVSAIIGSLIPLVPFLLTSVAVGMILSVVIAAVTLFAVGAYKARVTIGHPGRSGAEMATIGTLSALVGYGVGLVFKLPAVP